MDEKRKVRGNFRIYLQWPIFLSVLMVLLTAAVGAVSLRAGIIVSFFTLIYIGIALWIYFSRRKGILAGLIAFSQAYDKSKSKFLEEMLVPYCVADIAGRILWMNQEMEAILGDDKATIKNITQMFPDITKEMLVTGGETVTTLPRIPCARVSARRSAWLAPARWCLSMCLTLPSIRRTLPKPPCR